MEKNKECYKCGIGFPQIGTITSEESINEHEVTTHEVLCKECNKFFISSTHLRYHLEFNHDAKCNDCFDYCEQRCAENYALGAEAGKGVIEEGLAEKKEAIKEDEAQFERLTRGMTYNHIEMLQIMAKAIDTGYSGREALQWSKLLYLPFHMLPE